MNLLLSVVVPTYNRARDLGEALRAIIDQGGDAPAYEVIVVDNNSKDDTAAVVRHWADHSSVPIRYVLERSQGVSHARNAGVREALGYVIAFTDDDIRVGDDWIKAIHEVVAAHPGVDYFGSRVVPQWKERPPEWIQDPRHWAPLGMQDYGDKPVEVSARNPVCMISANLITKKYLFDRYGYFTPDFQRTAPELAGCEDHDLQLRWWRQGVTGMYAPRVVAYADVQVERMTKTFHRAFHDSIGRVHAAMRVRERMDEHGRLCDPVEGRTIAGAPPFLYREFAKLAVDCIKTHVSAAGESERLASECNLRESFHYIRACRRRKPHVTPAALAPYPPNARRNWT